MSAHANAHANAQVRARTLSKAEKDHAIVVWWKQCFLACGEHHAVFLIANRRQFRASH